MAEEKPTSLGIWRDELAAAWARLQKREAEERKNTDPIFASDYDRYFLKKLHINPK